MEFYRDDKFKRQRMVQRATTPIVLADGTSGQKKILSAAVDSWGRDLRVLLLFQYKCTIFTPLRQKK